MTSKGAELFAAAHAPLRDVLLRDQTGVELSSLPRVGFVISLHGYYGSLKVGGRYEQG